MEWDYWHINILYCFLINGITGTVWTLIWLPVMKLMKKKGRIRTVYVLLKFAMGGYILPVIFGIYSLRRLFMLYEINDYWVYTDTLYLILTIIGMIWLAGILVSGIRFIIGCIQMNQYCKSRYLPSAKEQECLLQIKSQLGIRRKVRLYHGYKVKSPFSTNFISPVIYLKSRDYDDKELRIVLTHELYHIKYWDILWKPLFSLIACFYWFHPLVFYVKKQYSRWSEANCDNHCYEDHFEEKDYFFVIINTIMENYAYVNNLASNWCENKKEAIWRMELMQESKEKKWRAELSVLTIILVIAISLFFTWLTELGSENLYSMIVDQTRSTLFVLNQPDKKDSWSNADSNDTLHNMETVSWIRQNIVENDDYQYVIGQIDSHELDVRSSVRSEFFCGETGDSVTMIYYLESDDAEIEMGIISDSGKEVYVNVKEAVDYNLIIQEDDEYAFFIRNLESYPVELYGAYSVTPAGATEP